MKRDRLLWFFAINYFAQGMGGIAYEPVSYYLKDALHLGPAQSAAFVAWMTLPLTIKPLFGVLTDFLPWAGKRRRPHLIAVSLVTSAAWLLLSGLQTVNYLAALLLLILVNVGFVMSDVVCDAVMVERGKERGLTGLYQALSIGTLYATLIVTGFGGGWLAQHATFRTIFALSALFPILTGLSALLIDENGVGDVKETATRGWNGLTGMFRDSKAWAVALGIFLWSFCPFLGTAEFYYQSEAIKLSPLFIGGLSTAGGFAGLFGAFVFGKLSGDTSKIAKASIWLGAPLTLLYVFYRGPVSIAAITAFFSLTGVVFRLAWMDLAAKACPDGAEATVFAAYMAVFNIAASASNTLGGRWYERLAASRGPYEAMLILSLIGTAGTLAAWPCLKAALRNDAARA